MAMAHGASGIGGNPLNRPKSRSRPERAVSPLARSGLAFTINYFDFHTILAHVYTEIRPHRPHHTAGLILN